MKTILALALLVAMLAIPTVVCAPPQMPPGWENTPEGVGDNNAAENAPPNAIGIDFGAPGFMEFGRINAVEQFFDLEFIPGPGLSEFAPPGTFPEEPI